MMQNNMPLTAHPPGFAAPQRPLVPVRRSARAGRRCSTNALSGGVDSSTVTMLGHRALGERLKAGDVVGEGEEL
jgi:hypothetical protein